MRFDVLSLYCAGILTFACPLLAIHFSLRTWTWFALVWFGFLFTTAFIIRRTVCSLRLIPSHYLSDFHSSIRIANFWIVYPSFNATINFSNHLQTFSSIALSHPHTVNNFACTKIALPFCRCLLCQQFSFYHFYCYFGFGSPKFAGYHLRMSEFRLSHTHIILRWVPLLCSAWFGSVDVCTDTIT